MWQREQNFKQKISDRTKSIELRLQLIIPSLLITLFIWSQTESNYILKDTMYNVL